MPKSKPAAQPNQSNQSKKTIVLIRHGESHGQAARSNGMLRSDPRLMDCSLTRKGVEQARGLRAHTDQIGAELIVVSPLKRALLTALNGFPTADNIIIHPHLCERGSRIPENQPRPFVEMASDKELLVHPKWHSIDTSLLPRDWPESHAVSKQRDDSSLVRWLSLRSEKTIAVVCHHNTIQHLIGLRDRMPVITRANFSRIENCLPIRCILDGTTLMTQQEIIDRRRQAIPSEDTWVEPRRKGKYRQHTSGR